MNEQTQGDNRGSLADVTYGHCFIAHCVFRSPALCGQDGVKRKLEEIFKAVDEITPQIYRKTCEVIQDKYSDAVLQTLFKNFRKTEQLAKAVLDPVGPEHPARQTSLLFSDPLPPA